MKLARPPPRAVLGGFHSWLWGLSRNQQQPIRQYSASSGVFGRSSENSTSTSTLISSRGAAAVGRLPSYLSDARSVELYSKDTPQGALQLGVAESVLLEDWLLPVFNQHPPVPADCIYYQPTMGRLAAREAFAAYMRELLDLPYTPRPDNIVLGAGCNAVLENLCMVLADPGDGILIPAPYYAAFEFDTGARAGLVVEPVLPARVGGAIGTGASLAPPGRLDLNLYYPTAASLDAALQSSRAAGVEPRILLLSHPHNPLAICYPADVLRECIDWAVARQIHVIADEIYAGSVYRAEDAGFVSALKLYGTAAASHEVSPYLHWVYSMSKDFCASGLRVGAAYTCNEEIRLPLQKLNDLCQLPSTTQVWVENLFRARMESSDETWTSAFRRENYVRLRARCDALTTALRNLGIPYLEATAGLFLWIDFSQFLPPAGTPEERERILYLELVRVHGLLFTPGCSMRHPEPGFFRFVFAAATDEQFDLALRRLRQFAKSKKKV